MDFDDFALAAQAQHNDNIGKLMADVNENPENYEDMDEDSWFESLRSFEEC